MRIPITRNFDSTRIVGFMEIKEDFAAELVALAKEGLTFRLDTGLRHEGDQTTLVEVSVSSAFPSVLSDSMQSDDSMSPR